jgi:hypothetical protein
MVQGLEWKMSGWSGEDGENLGLGYRWGYIGMGIREHSGEEGDCGNTEGGYR